MQCEIVAINRDDLKSLKEIAEKTFRATYQHLNDPNEFEEYIRKNLSTSALEDSLALQGSYYFFVKLEAKIAGYCHLLEAPNQTDLQEEKSLEISRIYLLDGYKGKGLGKRMINHVVKFGRIQKKEFLWLGVWEKNPEAIRFYSKMGFKPFGTHIFSIGSDHQTDILMRLNI